MSSVELRGQRFGLNLLANILALRPAAAWCIVRLRMREFRAETEGARRRGGDPNDYRGEETGSVVTDPIAILPRYISVNGFARVKRFDGDKQADPEFALATRG